MDYIGVDCHISSLDFAVVNERGTTTKRQRVNTGVKELIGFIRSVPKPRKVIIEEGDHWQTAIGDLYGLWREADCNRIVGSAERGQRTTPWMQRNWPSWPEVGTSRKFIVPLGAGGDFENLFCPIMILSRVRPGSRTS